VASLNYRVALLNTGLFYFCKVPKQFTLGKNERLKSRKQIELLFKNGRRINEAGIRALYILQDAEDGQHNLQLGVSVSSRNFKRAVDRNRIKRLLRESWRLQKNDLRSRQEENKKILLVFLIYTGKEMPAFHDLNEAVHAILNKLQNAK
jgi:ribonuclease P protein component